MPIHTEGVVVSVDHGSEVASLVNDVKTTVSKESSRDAVDVLLNTGTPIGEDVE